MAWNTYILCCIAISLPDCNHRCSWGTSAVADFTSDLAFTHGLEHVYPLLYCNFIARSWNTYLLYCNLIAGYALDQSGGTKRLSVFHGMRWHMARWHYLLVLMTHTMIVPPVRKSSSSSWMSGANIHQAEDCGVEQMFGLTPEKSFRFKPRVAPKALNPRVVYTLDEDMERIEIWINILVHINKNEKIRWSAAMNAYSHPTSEPLSVPVSKVKEYMPTSS
ncbi:hypothetical protein GGX14DRAFT_388517 [Mycena pura]|uniref:Uncharacterized protein n=1 Tax=Mycena pura TaxID=153505 RepID=A0AAD6YK56_9AGAR|nr:hypothetical protein GGX14DRAFT_388517 [Mycena pura]